MQPKKLRADAEMLWRLSIFAFTSEYFAISIHVYAMKDLVFPCFLRDTYNTPQSYKEMR